jgi:hypothetical protein
MQNRDAAYAVKVDDAFYQAFARKRAVLSPTLAGAKLLLAHDLDEVRGKLVGSDVYPATVDRSGRAPQGGDRAYVLQIGERYFHAKKARLVTAWSLAGAALFPPGEVEDALRSCNAPAIAHEVLLHAPRPVGMCACGKPLVVKPKPGPGDALRYLPREGACIVHARAMLDAGLLSAPEKRALGVATMDAIRILAGCRP